MTAGRAVARLRRLAGCGSVALLLDNPAHGQIPASAVPPTTPAATATAAPAAYVDRVLDDGPQPRLELERELRNASGWPRGWRVEYSSATERGSQPGSARGVALSGYLDTPNHGGLSLNAAINSTRSGQPGQAQSTGELRSWRIDQMGLPMDGGWTANHSAGNLSTLQVPMARGAGRIGLPTSPLQGLAAQYNLGSVAHYNASLGRPGFYSGQGINGFDGGRGTLIYAGTQHSFGSPSAGVWTAAAQLADAAGIANASDPAASQDVRGVWGAFRYQGTAPWADRVAPGTAPIGQRDGGLDIQFNLLNSQTRSSLPTSAATNGSGGWVDAVWRSGQVEHGAGIFQLAPDLRWGTYSAVSDLRGAYWRGDISNRQWQLGAAAEVAQSVSGLSQPSLYINLNGRYRLDTRNALLASLAVRRRNSPGESAQLAWETQSDWGQTQWRGDVLRSSTSQAQRFGVDHSFSLESDSTIALSLALERTRDGARSFRSVSWGIVGGLRPWTGVTLEANLRGSRANGGQQINGNLGVNWAIDSNWSLLTQLSSTRGADPQTFSIASALTEAATAAAAPPYSARRLVVTLRYEDRAGTLTAPLGGKPGSGSGSLTGVVFFDADDNNRRDASEAGVPDVTIRLNGRFVARTDAQGRYVFPAVATGRQRLEIIPDNVPLPWNPVTTEPQPVEVLVRSATTLDFPLRRDR